MNTRRFSKFLFLMNRRNQWNGRNVLLARRDSAGYRWRIIALHYTWWRVLYTTLRLICPRSYTLPPVVVYTWRSVDFAANYNIIDNNLCMSDSTASVLLHHRPRAGVCGRIVFLAGTTAASSVAASLYVFLPSVWHVFCVKNVLSLSCFCFFSFYFFSFWENSKSQIPRYK